MFELLRDGMELAAFGMTAVFILLGCLVLIVNAMSRIVRTLEPADIPAAVLPMPGGAEAAELTVAVAAAIHVYRQGRRR